MLRKFSLGLAGIAALATPALADFTNAIAPFWDSTDREGKLFQAVTSTVAYGSGSPLLVRVWAPSLLDSGTGPLQNNAAVTIRNGELVGVTSTSSSTSLNRAVIQLGLCRQLDNLGNYTSNNILVYEPGNWSDTVGNILPDGRVIYRSNFSTAGLQNNQEFSQLTPHVQTAIPEPDHGTKMFTGCGIDGAALTAFLGVPAVVSDGSGGMYLGQTDFDSGTGCVNPTLNIWHYTGTTLSMDNPNDDAMIEYSVPVMEAWSTAHGVPISPANDGRASQPNFQYVNNYLYNVFGYNDTSTGGSQRPLLLAIDMIRDPNGAINSDVTDSIIIYPPVTSPISTFVDHQATGAGSDPFFNKRFDMNRHGQIAIVSETQEPNVPQRYYQVLRYDPTFDGGGRINGYNAPVLIADAAPIGDTRDAIVDGLAAGLGVTAISGVSIDDQGNIGFNSNYATGQTDPIDSALYFYQASTNSLHRLLVEKQVINTPATGVALTLGIFPSGQSDMFFAPSMDKSAHVMSVNFGGFTADPNNPDPTRDPYGGSRGTLMVAIGHVGDVNFNGVTDLGDLAQVLAAYGSSYGSPNYIPSADLDLDGQINLSDIAQLLSNYGHTW